MTVDRDELRRLVDAATPGPWLAVVGSGPKRRCQQTALVGIADMRGQGAAGCLAVFAGLNGHRADDAEFIAAARTALPELLDMLDRVEAVLADPDDVLQVEDDDHVCPDFREMVIVDVERVRVAIRGVS